MMGHRVQSQKIFCFKIPELGPFFNQRAPSGRMDVLHVLHILWTLKLHRQTHEDS